jgi:hypothetical protein
MRQAGHEARMGKNRTVYRIVVGTSEGKIKLGRLRVSMKDNIDMDLNKNGWECMDGTHLGHCRASQAVVTTMMNFWAT